MKFLGHPVHQMLIVFPVGLLVTAFIFDIIGSATANPEWWRISYWMIPAGVVGGLTAPQYSVFSIGAAYLLGRAQAGLGCGTDLATWSWSSYLR